MTSPAVTTSVAVPADSVRLLLPDVSIEVAPSKDNVVASDSIVPASSDKVADPESMVMALLPLESIVAAASNDNVPAPTPSV